MNRPKIVSITFDVSRPYATSYVFIVFTYSQTIEPSIGSELNYRVVITTKTTKKSESFKGPQHQVERGGYCIKGTEKVRKF